MYARAAQLQYLAAYGLERTEVEELLAVIAEIAFGAVPGLHPVRADQPARRNVANHQVIADPVKPVAVQATTVGVRQTLAHFAIEHQVSQALAFRQVGHRLRERNMKQGAGRDRTVAVLNQNRRRRHVASVECTGLQLHCANVICVFRCPKRLRRTTWTQGAGFSPQ
jgi:hypothetical protein